MLTRLLILSTLIFAGSQATAAMCIMATADANTQSAVLIDRYYRSGDAALTSLAASNLERTTDEKYLTYGQNNDVASNIVSEMAAKKSTSLAVSSLDNTVQTRITSTLNDLFALGGSTEAMTELRDLRNKTRSFALARVNIGHSLATLASNMTFYTSGNSGYLDSGPGVSNMNSSRNNHDALARFYYRMERARQDFYAATGLSAELSYVDFIFGMNDPLLTIQHDGMVYVIVLNESFNLSNTQVFSYSASEWNQMVDSAGESQRAISEESFLLNYASHFVEESN